MTDALEQPAAGRRRSYGTLAGVLFALGALLSVPSSLLADAPAPLACYLLTAGGVASEIICFLLPWERYPLSVFHLVAVIATLEVVVVVRLFDPFYTYLFFVVAIYVAYIFPSPREVIPHLCFICFAIALPLIYDRGHFTEALRFTLFAEPIVISGAAMVSYLRLELDHREREYARLAGETGRLLAWIKRRLRGSAAAQAGGG